VEQFIKHFISVCRFSYVFKVKWIATNGSNQTEADWVARFFGGWY